MTPFSFRTLYDFQQHYKDSIATGLDFKTVCEDVSGIDFTDFFNQWYFGEGYPTFSAIWSQEEDTVYLNSIQTTSTAITTLFKTPIEFKLNYAGGSQTFRLYQMTNDTIFKIVIPHEITGIAIDPNNWILNQQGSITHMNNLRLKVFLEGPFNEYSGHMNSSFDPDDFPLNQPYSQPPWNFSGAETIPEIPTSNVVDWVLIELRDANSASQATSVTTIAQMAALLLNNGSIVSMDESSPLQFYNSVTQQLYVVLHHRNHLSIMSAIPLDYDKGFYNYDFSVSSGQIYQGISGSKELSTGIWGMIAGDSDANGTVELADKTNDWNPTAGKRGYLFPDLNLDGQSDNLDKDNYWLPNNGKGSQVPL